MLLLDTHILLWLDNGNTKLTERTRNLLESYWSIGGHLGVSAISAWEIAQLTNARRISLDVKPEEWILRFTEQPRIKTVPLTVAAATRAYALPGFPYKDPADRLLIAISIELECPLVTRDQRILNYAAAFGRSIQFQALDA